MTEFTWNIISKSHPLEPLPNTHIRCVADKSKSCVVVVFSVCFLVASIELHARGGGK